MHVSKVSFVGMFITNTTILIQLHIFKQGNNNHQYLINLKAGVAPTFMHPRAHSHARTHAHTNLCTLVYLIKFRKIDRRTEGYLSRKNNIQIIKTLQLIYNCAM